MCPRLSSLTISSCVLVTISGCVNLENPENFGLGIPISALSDVVSRHATAESGLSRADIWAMSAVVGADLSQRPNSRIDFDLSWWGRVDCENTGSVCLDTDQNTVPCTATLGPHRNLPGIDLNTADLYAFFENEFGFDQRETVTIMGAHTIGALATEVSCCCELRYDDL
jgi:Peroxidase